jgi:hypothetical protein
MVLCDSYLQHGLEYLCYSLEHPAECSCGGDVSKCDFFPENREPEPKLELCPFCGGSASYLEGRAWVWNAERDVFLAVRCTECGCRTKGVKVNGVDSSVKRKAMAAVEWNRRAGDGTEKD